VYTIVLDAGHQSIPNADTGCSGFGIHEEDIVLDICKRAKSLIELNNIKVIMTRDGTKVNGDGSSLNASLNTRCKIANDNKVDLFLSCHCDAFNSQAYGTTCHIFGTGGNSERFAKILSPLMGKLFYNRGIKVSNFQVLRNTEYKVGDKTISIPAVLLETAFLDNKDDNAKLADPNARQEIAINIAKSICVYFFGVDYVYKDNNISTIQTINNNNQGSEFKMDCCIVYFSSADYSSALILSNLNKSCAMFCRNASPSVNSYALKSKKIIVVGGPKLNVSGEIYLSGNLASDTLIAVSNYLQG